MQNGLGVDPQQDEDVVLTFDAGHGFVDIGENGAPEQEARSAIMQHLLRIGLVVGNIPLAQQPCEWLSRFLERRPFE